MHDHDHAKTTAAATWHASARKPTADERMPPQGVLSLQSTAGNAAVVQMLRQAGHPWAQEQHQNRAGGGHQQAEQPAVQRSAVHDVLRTGGKPLDEATRTEMEARLEADFSDVRIHNDSAARASAAEVGARAYTSGSHVVVGAGGTDKHTLAHELTHVIQQRRGTVAGTDNGAGLYLSHPGDRFERAAEANAARVMAGPVPDSPAPHGCAERSAASGIGPVLQRRTATSLHDQLAEDDLPADVAEIVKRYDKLTDLDLNEQARELGRIQSLLPNGPSSIRDVVESELKHVTDELTSLQATMSTPDGPYDLMTQQGLLWTDEDFPMNTAAVGETGRPYFEKLSAGNLQGLREENANIPNDLEWYKGMRDELERTLNGFMVRHYAPKERIEGVLSSGLQSRAKLETDHGGGANNTDTYDVHALANTGFVFFYIEAPESGFRGSRFGNEARISLGLKESGLLSNGWVMLSDFAAREFPTLLVERSDPPEVQSRTKNVNRFLRENKNITKLREFKRDPKLPASEPPRPMTVERRGELNRIRTQIAEETKSRQRYTGPQKSVLERPELLHQNLLVGPDIIPGLVERLLADVARISEVDPQAGKTLRSKSAKDLALFLFKDVVRPQAMVPASVHVDAQNVEYAN
ncbi:DUF4157 domain-containing protein [Streptomyces sp. NPDC087849]|uniref:eCIS core domain-containing protein n=1 Tax=Streptomyces sp. NPDC087849 TaxID=3365808 RepID=UPI00382ACD81